MKPNSESVIVALPLEASISGDDCYLVEMNDRLHRLRALVGENSAQAKPRRRWLNRIRPQIMM